MHGAHDRPVYLNLLQIRLPVAGVLSILHRITGLLMFLATPLIIYLLDLSLGSAAGYAQAGELLHGGLGTIALFGLLWSLLHHLFAGVRYLLLDVHIGVDKPYYRYSAWVVLIAAPLVAAVVAGVLL